MIPWKKMKHWSTAFLPGMYTLEKLSLEILRMKFFIKLKRSGCYKRSYSLVVCAVSRNRRPTLSLCSVWFRARIYSCWYCYSKWELWPWDCTLTCGEYPFVFPQIFKHTAFVSVMSTSIFDLINVFSWWKEIYIYILLCFKVHMHIKAKKMERNESKSWLNAISLIWTCIHTGVRYVVIIQLYNIQFV